MRPKLEACLHALEAGVGNAYIIDGRSPALAAARAVHRRGHRYEAVALAELQALEREAVMGTYVRNPVEFVRGEGTRLWDDEGNEYLDFLGGISVAQLGHCHPAVVAAVREQAGRLMHVGNLYYTEPGMRLAARLSELLARRQGVPLQLRHGGDRVRHQAGPPRSAGRRLRGDRGRLPRPHDGRPLRHAPGGQAGALRTARAGLPCGPRGDGAASAGGRRAHGRGADRADPGRVRHPPDRPELLAAAREACDEYGALLVFDEIQCGMGRTGTLWAWQQLRRAPGRDDRRQGPGWRAAGRRLRGGAPSSPTSCSRATTARPSPAAR